MRIAAFALTSALLAAPSTVEPKPLAGARVPDRSSSGSDSFAPLG